MPILKLRIHISLGSISCENLVHHPIETEVGNRKPGFMKNGHMCMVWMKNSGNTWMWLGVVW